MILRYYADEEITVKEFLLKQGISRILGKKIKLYGKLKINQIEARNWFVLKVGDILEVEYQEPENTKIIPSDKSLEVVYEDDYILIADKPFNLSTQPSAKHYYDNLVSRVKHYFIHNGITDNIHIVNRLDYATSGLVIVAKNGFVHYRMAQIPIEKKYVALVSGYLEEQEGIINLPIDRESEDSIKRAVDSCGKPAVTEFRVLDRHNETSLLELKLGTGRCHQIRVHLSHIGHPVIGDAMYGEGKNRLFLHSCSLAFFHPFTKEKIEKNSFPCWFYQFLK